MPNHIDNNTKIITFKLIMVKLLNIIDNHCLYT